MSSAPLDRILGQLETLYREWLASIGGEARRGQWRMMQSIVETCLHDTDGERLAAIEAGTGTGKTLAYLLAGAMCARALEKKLLIATSTVVLQEQVLRELTNIATHTSLEFKAGVVKGRGRYLCPLKLEQQSAPQAQLDLGAGEEPRTTAGEERTDSAVNETDARHTHLLTELADAWRAGEWDGDRDHWTGDLPWSLWHGLTNSRAGCLREHCLHYRVCPFFLARTDSESFDLLVVNQDLLLADLTIGGGAILPKPEEVIAVIDEAHNLADKARRSASRAANPGGFMTIGQQTGETLERALKLLGHDEELREAAEIFAERLQLLAAPAGGLTKALSGLEFESSGKDAGLCYFAGGRLPDKLLELSDQVHAHLEVMAAQTAKILKALQAALDNLSAAESRGPYEALLIDLGEQAAHLQEQAMVMHNFAPVPESSATDAACGQRVRWSVQDRQRSGSHSFGLCDAPLFPGELLSELLWPRFHAVLCTSASLRGLGSFSNFQRETGIAACARLEHIESPFPYRDMVTLRVPRGLANPRYFREHTNDIAHLLPDLMAEEKAGLILFTSWRQLNEVHRRLPPKCRKQVLSQDAFAAGRLVQKHKAAVDRGRRSYLMGVASFAEGLDLPDEYCRHVIIAKLPFMVPTDPVQRAMREWYEAHNEDAFRTLSLPCASLKLAQACGRLVRNENDYGRITLLDNRADSTAWGRELLDSLPPYRRVSHP